VLLNTFLIILLIIVVGSLQMWFGFKKQAILGTILPVILILFVIYFMVKGVMALSFRDIVAPVLGLLGLIAIYVRGEKMADTKQKG
jgi:hypothetical protein